MGGGIAIRRFGGHGRPPVPLRAGARARLPAAHRPNQGRSPCTHRMTRHRGPAGALAGGVDAPAARPDRRAGEARDHRGRGYSPSWPRSSPALRGGRPPALFTLLLVALVRRAVTLSDAVRPGRWAASENLGECPPARSGPVRAGAATTVVVFPVTTFAAGPSDAEPHRRAPGDHGGRAPVRPDPRWRARRFRITWALALSQAGDTVCRRISRSRAAGGCRGARPHGRRGPRPAGDAPWPAEPNAGCPSPPRRSRCSCRSRRTCCGGSVRT